MDSGRVLQLRELAGMMRAVCITVAVLLMSGTVGAAQVKMDTVTVWPLILRNNDTVTVDNNASTHTKLTLSTMTVIITTGNVVSNAEINLDRDTVEFGNGGTGTGYFLNVGAATTSRGSNIYLHGKSITQRAKVTKLGDTGDGIDVLAFGLINNSQVKFIDFTGDGDNCRVFGAGPNIRNGPNPNYGLYNMEFHGNLWSNKCITYTSRESYDGAAWRMALTPELIDSAQGRYYTAYIHEDTVVESHHEGFHIRGMTVLKNCGITCDERNDKYDTVYACGSAPIGASSANAYGIHVREGDDGVRVENCKVRSGTTYFGCRGVLVEKTRGNPSGFGDSAYFVNNDIQVHEGKYCEPAGGNGNLEVFRIRDDNDYYVVRGNIIIGTVDADTNTSSYEANCRVFYLSLPATIDPHCTITNNQISCLTNGGTHKSYSAEAFIIEGDCTGDEINISGNDIDGCQKLIGLGSVQAFTTGFRWRGRDTVRFGATTVAGAKTLTMGRSSGGTNSLDDTLENLVFLNGASPYDVTFNGTGLSCEYFVRRTCEIRVVGTDGNPIKEPTIKVWNHYQDTTLDSPLLQQIAGTDGKLTATFTHHYESDDFTDSLNTQFNPFIFRANKNATTAAVSNSVTYATDQNNQVVTITLGIAEVPNPTDLKSGVTVKKGVTIK